MLIKLIIYNNMKKILTLLAIGIVAVVSCKKEEMQNVLSLSTYYLEVGTSVNGNGKCTDFGNRECSDFGNNNAPISVTTIHNFR